MLGWTARRPLKKQFKVSRLKAVQVGSISHQSAGFSGRPSAARSIDRAEAAAVNAIASGSQHRTIKAISQRMARSLSRYPQKVRPLADRCRLGLDLPALRCKRRPFRLEVGQSLGLPLPLLSERRTRFVLPGRTGPASPGASSIAVSI
jgi:hypothetical protein